MSRANSILNHKHGFYFQKPWHNHRESKLFLTHVDMGEIELQALKKSFNGGDDLGKN